MRMRARVISPRTLHRFVKCVEKIGPRCVVRFTRSRIHLVVKDSEGRAQVWSVLSVDSVFEGYLVESKYDNEIWLELDVADFLRALRSMLSGYSSSLRLSRDCGVPVLSVSITCDFVLHNQNTNTIQYRNQTPQQQQQHQQLNPEKLVSGDDQASILLVVKAEPLRRAQIIDLREPRVSPQDVYIFLPALPVLRNVIDRFKGISPTMTLSANNDGELLFVAESPSGRLETLFTSLDNATPSSCSQESNSAEQTIANSKVFSGVTLDVKDFMKFLQCYHANPSHVICGIKEGFCLVFYVYILDSGTADKTRIGNQSNTAGNGRNLNQEENIGPRSQGEIDEMELRYYIPAIQAN